MNLPEHDLSCAVHIHSTFSDGTATVPEIAAAAADCGRDVVLLTDHDTLGARRAWLEGWHGSVLVLVGVEINTGRGHYLAFGLKQEIDRLMGEDRVPAAVAAAGGFGFAAHPFSTGSRISHRLGPPQPWDALSAPCLGGLELVSLQTDLAESWRGPAEIWRGLRDPEAAEPLPTDAALRAWDRLCRERPLVGIGGLDAHQKGLRVGDRVLSPMPHRRWLGLLGTHVLCRRPPSGELAADRAEVYAALREGRCYVARDSLADPAGFSFRAEDGERALPMGATARAGRWRLTAAVPRPARLLLRRDGEEVAAADRRALEHEVREPGAYRVEALLERSGGPPRRWIVSNPIYLR